MAEILGNFAEVEAYFLSLIPRVGAAGKEIEEQSARIVADLAASRAPVLTGELQASVGEEGGEVVVTSDHAIFQEYGTRRNKAQPFLRPARDASEPIVRELAEGIITVSTR